MFGAHLMSGSWREPAVVRWCHPAGCGGADLCAGRCLFLRDRMPPWWRAQLIFRHGPDLQCEVLFQKTGTALFTTAGKFITVGAPAQAGDLNLVCDKSIRFGVLGDMPDGERVGVSQSGAACQLCAVWTPGEVFRSCTKSTGFFSTGHIPEADSEIIGTGYELFLRTPDNAIHNRGKTGHLDRLVANFQRP